MAKSDIYQIVCGMLASIQLDADDALQACSFLAQEGTWCGDCRVR